MGAAWASASSSTDFGCAVELVPWTENLWWIDEAKDYPRLWWELPEGGESAEKWTAPRGNAVELKGRAGRIAGP